MQRLSRFFAGLPLRLWLLLGAALLFWNLGFSTFWNTDEARYAAAALEMAHPFSGAPDWIVPHLDTIPRLNKPPLVLWLGAISFHLFGVAESSARLVSAGASVAVMLGIFALGRAMFDERAATAGALVWATSLFPVAMSRVFNTDALLCAAMFFVFGGIWLAGENENNEYGRFRPYSWCAIGMGLALLAKGPVGVALPLLLGAIYLSLARRWKMVSMRGVLISFVVAFLIAAPWYFAIEMRAPGFNRRFLWVENFARFSGEAGHHNPTPVWFFVPVALLGLMPWTGFLPIAMMRAREMWRQRFGNRGARAQLFCWIWALGVIGFFSLSGTKLVSYILPAFPAFALLVGACFSGDVWTRAMQRTSLVVPMLLSPILAVAAFLYLTSDRGLPRKEGLSYASAFCAALLVMADVVWRVRHDRWKIFGAQTLGSCLVVVILLRFAGHFAKYEDASPMLRALAPHLKPSDTVALHGTFQPSVIFYARRPVPVFNFINNSGLDETHPNYRALFRPADLRLSSNRAFVLVKWDDDRSAYRDWRIIARNNDFRLLSNRPAPPGFAFDFTAPRKRLRP